MVVSRYAIPIGILCVEGLSMGPPGFGASHNILYLFFLVSIRSIYQWVSLNLSFSSIRQKGNN